MLSSPRKYLATNSKVTFRSASVTFWVTLFTPTRSLSTVARLWLLAVGVFNSSAINKGFLYGAKSTRSSIVRCFGSSPDFISNSQIERDTESFSQCLLTMFWMIRSEISRGVGMVTSNTSTSGKGPFRNSLHSRLSRLALPITYSAIIFAALNSSKNFKFSTPTPGLINNPIWHCDISTLP
ncbi:hypothetical protein NEDG_02231 [Nematocida displodere]|uniref:Uncharacterized protein n=1 Tax=Nematocida displodere TaxID=1805483 RepID=A0A177EHE7_9MICR|nr:hypothetical protein NEDG_02231 [Nematocida displodere]